MALDKRSSLLNKKVLWHWAETWKLFFVDRDSSFFFSNVTTTDEKDKSTPFVILSLENKMALRHSVGMNFVQITFGSVTIKWFCNFCLIKFLAKCHFDILSLEKKWCCDFLLECIFLQITFGPLTIKCLVTSASMSFCHFVT
jgi:hypothetical protein